REATHPRPRVTALCGEPWRLQVASAPPAPTCVKKPARRARLLRLIFDQPARPAPPRARSADLTPRTPVEMIRATDRTDCAVTLTPYDIDLDRNAANFQPLTPLSFLERSAAVFPDHTAIIHGALRRSYAEFYA